MRERFGRVQLGLAALFVLLATGLFAWRYREKSRAVQRLQGEIEQRKQLEARSSELRDQLFHAQRLEAVGTISAGVAHDINNALTVIVGNTQMAGLVEDAEKREEYLRSVLDSTELARGTTRSLLTYAQHESPDFEVIDLVELVRETCSFLRRVLPDEIELECTVPETDGIQCKADQNTLKQVLLNLVLNSRDAIPGNGSIHVTLALDSGPGERALLRVQDSGMGMSDAVRTRVFDPFFTTKKRGHGTGLGMSVAHGIVKDHGGDIHIQSTEGKGTMVTVALPTTEGQPERIRDVYLRPRGSGRVAMVAEDDEQVRSVVRQHLEDEGFRVMEFEDGEGLLERFQTEPSGVDVVVLDKGLPRMSGVDCLAAIREMSPEFPGVLMSGLPMDLPKSTRTACLSKPFGRDHLNHALHEVLEV